MFSFLTFEAKNELSEQLKVQAEKHVSELQARDKALDERLETELDIAREQTKAETTNRVQTESEEKWTRILEEKLARATEEATEKQQQEVNSLKQQHLAGMFRFSDLFFPCLLFAFRLIFYFLFLFQSDIVEVEEVKRAVKEQAKLEAEQADHENESKRSRSKAGMF
jgi:hypothetical protein